MGERSSFSKLLFLLGATIGAGLGLGFAQRKGGELRAQFKKSLQQGKNPAEAIAKDLLAAGKEVIKELEKLSETESVGELKEKISIQTKRLGEAARQHLTDLGKNSSNQIQIMAKKAKKAAKKVVKKAKAKKSKGKGKAKKGGAKKAKKKAAKRRK